VTTGQVQAIVDKIGDAGHERCANHVAQLIGAVYRYGRKRLKIKVENPAEADDLDLYDEGRRECVLSDEELRAFWATLQAPAEAPSFLSATMALALQFVCVTLQRGIECCGAHDDEIDLVQRTWSIPATRAKNRRPHLIPLSDLAVEIIEKARALREEGRNSPGYLFPGAVHLRGGGHEEERAIRRNSLTNAMRRLCAPEALNIPGARPHDLRRTGATNITGERIGIPRLHVSFVLNHASETGGTTSIYDRNSYLKEKRLALDAWGRLLLEIVGGEAGSNVIALRR
jgi:integrase